ncbi:MAG: thiol:disulfide interchange protein [Halioglobus sp.]
MDEIKLSSGDYMRATLAVLMLLISNTGFTAGLGGNTAANPFDPAAVVEFLSVEEAYQLETEVQADGSIRLYWQIAPAYYLYQHRFSFTLTDELGEIELTTQFPPALEKTDEYFGEVSVYYQDADLVISPKRNTDKAQLEVASQGCADAGLCYPPHKQYFDVDFTTGSVTPTDAQAPAAATPKTSDTASQAEAVGLSKVLYMMVLAFFGGSILNLMPCVFPVLSLKMLSFARSADHQHHIQSWVYAAGVVCSFVLVAAILIFLQRAGAAIGWGFHLQSPGFVIAMAYLFVVMGLSLSGVVEFGSSVMGAGSNLAEREGLSGSFFTGVLAVIVASPCTAPFMGTALGFAVTQPAVIALGVFAALGAGMAAPMVLLSYNTGLRSRMPKPGAWMETLKQVLAFPLYATAIWLFWVAGRQTGVNTMALALMGALLIALGLWLWRFSGWRKGMAIACMLAAMTAASWRGLDESSQRVSQEGHVAWSEQSLEQLRSSGQPVFVDVTADWCISCIANEQAVLFTDEISAAFKDSDITYMVADWTNYDADIAAYLANYGRNGIPFYILYSGDPAVEPLILPQLLTKSIVLAAILQVSSNKGKVATILE